jgi:hypothetical protein
MVVAPLQGLARWCGNPGLRSFLAAPRAITLQAFGPPEALYLFAAFPDSGD